MHNDSLSESIKEFELNESKGIPLTKEEKLILNDLDKKERASILKSLKDKDGSNAVQVLGGLMDDERLESLGIDANASYDYGNIIAHLK